MSRALETRLAKLEIVRCGAAPYVVRVSDPRSPSERADLELARTEGRQIAIMPHPCRSIDDWAAKCRTIHVITGVPRGLP
jgi:hypothetical protein